MTISGVYQALDPVIPAEAPGPIDTTIVQFSTTSGSGGVMGPGFGYAASG
jgi:hypothetical protein